MIDRPMYVSRIMSYVDTPFVKILKGARRSGKSTILKMVICQLVLEKNVSEEAILNYRLDSMEYEGMTAKELFEELKTRLCKGKTYIFLDEVQEIEGWERVVNSLLSDYDVDIYVTGSNSRMMSSELSTYLTGRYISFHIYTLSFAEYLAFKRSYGELVSTKSELVNYLRLGGFPATHLRQYSDDEVYGIVRDIYRSILFSDIVKRAGIKKIDLFERVVRFVFDNVGNTFSANSISNYLKAEKRKVSSETVYNYLDKLEKAYLVHRCSRYDLTGKAILKTQEKFYLADTALRYSVLGYSPSSVASSLENMVYLELCRRGYVVHVGKFGDFEIDFVAERQNERLYIQVTQEIRMDKTERREYEKLLEIQDNYPKYVLRIDDFAEGNYKGIITMHVADFLLAE